MSQQQQQQHQGGHPVRSTSAGRTPAAVAQQHRLEPHDQTPQSTSPSDLYANYASAPSPSAGVYAGMEPESAAASSYPHFAAGQAQQAVMYPVDLSSGHSQGPSQGQGNRRPSHQDMRPSIDADLSDQLQQSAQDEEHSRPHPNGGGARALRFDTSQPAPTGTYMHNSESSTGLVAATDFAAGKELSEKHHHFGSVGSKEGRSLPAGYHTPPAFSRASSGWSARLGGNGKAEGGSGSPATGKTHPYGQLGGAASVSDPALQFAKGDYANSAFARFWLMIVSKNIVVRWLCFIVPVLALLWIPGICGFTINPTPTVWQVNLINWSIWLTIAWVGWWAAMLVAMAAPHVLKHTIGQIAPEARHYIDYLFALKKTLSAALWTLAMWISFQPLILSQGPADRSTGAGLTLSQMTKGLFAFWICAVILLVEKLIIQVIAYNFHKTSYADRIAENKFAVKSLVTLYLNSNDIGRSDTLDGAFAKGPGGKGINPAKFVKKGLRNARKVVTGASTALGTVASEIVGERVLQSNSPHSMVTTALASASKSRQLARRVFFSFTPSSRHVMLQQDIARFFPNQEQLASVYAIFDKDENGDVSLEEIEMACLDIHRERQSLASSMRDLDSAVARLDQIFVSLWYIVSILIIIGLVSISFSSFVTTGATFVLGLSWLIGGTSQEVLAAIIFLLAKHPFDVQDLIQIDGYEGTYVVKEIMLLSTIFKKTDGNVVQIPHTILNTKAIINYRRSGATSESVTWDVEYGTTFEKIEELRNMMIEFVEHEKRDFLPNCDISVVSFNDQSKLTLSAAIPYKSNWSNAALKSQRRNKWICALKIAMGELSIFGPGGSGNPSPAPADPQVIRLLNPEAAPSYRSPTPGGSTNSGSGTGAAGMSSPPLAGAIPSNPQQRDRTQTQPSPNLAASVNRFELASRDVVRDEATDIYDLPGGASREDTIDAGKARTEALAQGQLSAGNEGRSTAVDAHAAAASSNEGTRVNRFRQPDLELGSLAGGSKRT